MALAFCVRCSYPHTNPPSGGIHLLWASPFYRGKNKAIQPVSSEFTNSSHLCRVCPWFTDALSIFFPATSTHFHAGAQPWTCPRSCLPNVLSLHPTKHLGGSPGFLGPPPFYTVRISPPAVPHVVRLLTSLYHFPSKILP